MTYNHVQKNVSITTATYLPTVSQIPGKTRLPILDESGHIATQPPREQIGGKIDG